MSEALERVIAEQQKQIDSLMARDKSNIEAWVRENKKRERVASAAFEVLNDPTSPESHFELKQSVMAWGYCPTCECSPCECEYD